MHSKLPVSSGILWQSFLKPLHPASPKLKLFGEKDSLEIEVDAPLSPAFDEVMALNRLNGRAGFHLALFWVQPGPLSTARPGEARRFAITLRSITPGEPSAAPVSREGAEIHHHSLSWQIQNSHYRLMLNRQGGVIRELCGADGKVRFAGQDLVARKGLTPSLLQPRLSADMETFVRLYQENGGLKLRFLGWLRNAANHGVARPGAWVFTEYAFSGAPGVDAVWQLRLSDAPAPESDLRWSLREKDHAFSPAARQWQPLAYRLDASGLHERSAAALPDPVFVPGRLWSLYSSRDARRFPCLIAPFLPGDDPQVYFSEFQVGEEAGEPVFRGELPMMWPHLTLPVSFNGPGQYRLRTTLKTDRVETEGPAGSAIQLQLLYRGIDGKPVSLNRSFPVPNGTRDRQTLAAEFEVPPGVTGGNIRLLVYKLFGSGAVTLTLPVLEPVR